ncbi:core-2/I-branching enzyme [Pluralibacter gergoviae]|nr:core-2/I-branching enzyme [Pluralibacter gergoviae]ELD4275045.1 core-2/I-branching enzyme [Pluralibacter gergoviae]ELD4316339.1 core-2/I-branching enzyme [Pluralibacter gergoviae]ELD4341055.1 core-2/I-branching enzyme [Pluralibacter gergoviae]
MNKVFAITCHKVTKALIFTVSYLSKFKENIIIIHVDKKSKMEEFKFLECDNVIFIKERENIFWGSISQIKATISLLQYSLLFNFEYFFLLSGDDVPVASNEIMNNFLKKNFGMDFFHFQDKRNNYVNPVFRVKYNYLNIHFMRRTSIVHKVGRRLHQVFKILFINRNYTKNAYRLPVLYKGVNWFGATKSSVEYILNYINENPWYLALFRKSLCADEVFFHSIINTNVNSVFYFNNDSLNNALRYIDWHSGPEYPKILNNDDFFSIIKQQVFFARKISDTFDLKMIENHIGCQSQNIKPPCFK